MNVWSWEYSGGSCTHTTDRMRIRSIALDPGNSAGLSYAAHFANLQIYLNNVLLQKVSTATSGTAIHMGRQIFVKYCEVRPEQEINGAADRDR